MVEQSAALRIKADARIGRPLPGSAGHTDLASHRHFSINGRFLSQPVTGVQRYAGEVVRALDALLSPAGNAVKLITPAALDTVPVYRSIAAEQFGAGASHLWEQAFLPLRASGPLLNLCNTAPALVRNQVVCIHDANVVEMPASYSVSFRLLYRSLQPWIARRAARLTTVSKDAAGRLARIFGISAASIAVLPNGHEHALRWDASRSVLFDRVPPRRPYILLLGSRAIHKNIGRIVGLAGAVDDIGLDVVIAGGDAAVFAPTMVTDAPNIRWLGRVSDDDLALLLRHALCLAFPSLAEGFGLPIIEAMAHGCPVVSSDRTSLPEVCGGAALLADPTDDASWLRHFRTLLGSTECRAELRERGRRHIRRYSWTETARGYLHLFDQGSL